MTRVDFHFNTPDKLAYACRLIRKIQAALTRIDDGTYGICEDCGDDISVPRLKARPVTRLCINCKAKQEEDEHLRGD